MGRIGREMGKARRSGCGTSLGLGARLWALDLWAGSEILPPHVNHSKFSFSARIASKILDLGFFFPRWLLVGPASVFCEPSFDL